jgi:Polycystin cation channel
VWSLVIVAFACTGLLMFNHNLAFVSITDAFYFLICAALGNWDSAAFNRENWDILVNRSVGGYLTENDIYMGKLFLLVFQMFNAIILLNFVIAVLSSTYSEL